MDPLSVLREYTMRPDLESIKQVGDEFLFGDEYRFPCNMDTAYRSKQGSLYTLDSLVFFVKNTHMKHTDYMQQARALKLQTVTFIDRKGLLDYLEGRVQNSDAIELLAPTAVTSVVPPSHLHHLDPPSEDDVEEYRPDDPSFAPSKRSRLDDAAGDVGVSAAGMAEYEPAEMDASRMISFIKERERPIRDRNTILLCHNKDFQEILTMLTKRDEEKKKAEELKEAADKQQGSGRYGHVEDKRFWREHLGADADELGIDPTHSYKQQKDLMGGKGKVDVMRGGSHHHRQSMSMVSAPRGGAASLATANQKGAKIEGGPIILVPSAFQTLLNMYNAKEFLEDGVFVAADVKAKADSKKPEVVTFLRKMGRDKPVKYEVRDKPTVLSAKDWERVVAVFVLGKEWQFKDWPFKDHVEIFSKIMGIYLRFEDDSVDSAKVVKQWNVKIISLSKHKRHQDRTAVLQFWDALEAFIRARRVNILF